jgi:uncharacterized coiled-coil DUF342 family protein
MPDRQPEARETLERVLREGYEVIAELATDKTVEQERVTEEVREVLSELADCEQDHPLEPWASELKAERDQWQRTADERARQITELERKKPALDLAHELLAGQREEIAELGDEVERSHKAILALTAEVERLRAAIVEWGRAESLPDCSACVVFDAALTGSE